MSYLCSFLAIATTNSLALAEGRGDGNGAATFLREAIGLATVLGIFIAFAGWFGSEPLLRSIVDASSSNAVNTTNNMNLVLPAANYLKARSVVMPFALSGMVALSTFASSGQAVWLELAWEKK